MKENKSDYELTRLNLDENFYRRWPVLREKAPTFGETVLKFCFLSGAVFGFFILNGIVQEKLFRVPGFQTFGWFLTLIQAAVYILLSYLDVRLRGQPLSTSVPKNIYAAVAFISIATTGLSNASVGYMNYPTQLMFKSCKIIPVMIGGILIQRKSYGPYDFGAAFSMTVGLIFFSLADVEVAPNFQIKVFTGIVMVCLSLCADAVIGNLQEKLLTSYRISNAHLIFWSYCIGFLYIFAGILLTGELVEAYKFCSKHPLETYPLMLIFGITGYFGVNAILMLINHFGAVLAVTVTTFRKTLTVCLSFIFFTKPFTVQYVWSGLLVVLGIYMSVYAKNQSNVDSVLFRCCQCFIVKVLPRKPVINLV